MFLSFDLWTMRSIPFQILIASFHCVAGLKATTACSFPLASVPRFRLCRDERAHGIVFDRVITKVPTFNDNMHDLTSNVRNYLLSPPTITTTFGLLTLTLTRSQLRRLRQHSTRRYGSLRLTVPRSQVLFYVLVCVCVVRFCGAEGKACLLCGVSRFLPCKHTRRAHAPLFCGAVTCPA